MGLKRRLLNCASKHWFERQTGGFPAANRVSLDQTDRVILDFSAVGERISYRAYAQEVALASVLAERGLTYALTKDASKVFGKRVFWTVPSSPRGLMSPRLANYSRQMYDFAVGLEAQENKTFISSVEAGYWENKGYMHRRFFEEGIPSPTTVLLGRDTWRSQALPEAPLLLKEEHSSGSAGIHFCESHPIADAFLASYSWMPGESLVAQSVVAGATKDLRLTLVGDKVVHGASYWRIKDPAMMASGWTTTASTYNSTVEHGHVPEGLAAVVGAYMRRLGIRTAGIDIMWEGDDVCGPPLLLEASPLYQPNPPKPERYARLTYKQYKRKYVGPENYLAQQFATFQEVARLILDEGFF